MSRSHATPDREGDRPGVVGRDLGMLFPVFLLLGLRFGIFTPRKSARSRWSTPW